MRGAQWPGGGAVGGNGIGGKEVSSKCFGPKLWLGMKRGWRDLNP